MKKSPFGYSIPVDTVHVKNYIKTHSESIILMLCLKALNKILKNMKYASANTKKRKNRSIQILSCPHRAYHSNSYYRLQPKVSLLNLHAVLIPKLHGSLYLSTVLTRTEIHACSAPCV